MKYLKFALLTTLILTLLSTNVFALSFKDVPDNYSLKTEIEWSVNEGIFVGSNGYFGPEDNITEAQLVTVLCKFTGITPKSADTQKVVGGLGHWSDAYYEAIKPYDLPLKGFNSVQGRNTALTRGQIARIIAAKNGFNLNEEQSIYYMYENELSYGVKAGVMTYDSYGRNLPLTRAQAAAFIMRLNSVGITTFLGTPSKAGAKDIIGVAGVTPSTAKVDFSDVVRLESSESFGGNPLVNPTWVNANLDGDSGQLTTEGCAEYGAYLQSKSGNMGIRTHYGIISQLPTAVDMAKLWGAKDLIKRIATFYVAEKGVDLATSASYDYFSKIMYDDWVKKGYITKGQADKSLELIKPFVYADYDPATASSATIKSYAKDYSVYNKSSKAFIDINFDFNSQVMSVTLILNESGLHEPGQTAPKTAYDMFKADCELDLNTFYTHEVVTN